MDVIDSQNQNGAPSPEHKSELSEVDVRSNEIQEIIGRPPHWLIRWGITAFFGVLLLIGLSAWTIKYPETVKAPLKLTAINAPKTLQSSVDGKLIRLLHPNNTKVAQNEILAWLESTADHRQVLSLASRVDSMRAWLGKSRLEKFDTVHLTKFSNLGELQRDFQSFEQAFRQFVSYLPGGFYSQKRKSLQQELQYTKQLLAKLKQQKEIQQADLEVAQQKYEAQKKLAEKDLIAPIEFAQQESEYHASRLPLQQTESSIIRNHAEQAAKRQQLLELEQEMDQQKAVFLQALNTLKSAVEEWEDQFMIVAPVSGKLIYAGILQENQTLRAGQEVFYVQPENTRFFGEMPITQNSFGKVRVGQQVQVRFSSYPYQEFGKVIGTLDYLSDVPVQDSVFLGKVKFPEGLTTNYNRELKPRNGMMGQAEIITQDMRLLERFYNNIAKQLR
ncbi:HlyD family secretion protein [Aliifodinibius sp. S!AR15-10]|uniref:HlyD family efflux transporter periplasmic adaptor subunit n=1 Tax=Aliifodinibius sp. S!AR15-10 TaxID=2950437 RepID=UPI00285F46C5|nr:HlyD family efflux transporter periplasmic adaptor subunit [Aliifodinibius sp. S!AR15-10]MDR8393849.1 HlyD family secretion protein [Aliifodinibius sp. S!AR15-10]